MEIYLRDGISKIEQLKPYSFHKNDGVIRYDFFQMRSIVETNLGFGTGNCGKYFHSNTESSYEWHVRHNHDVNSKDADYNVRISNEYKKALEDGETTDTPYMNYWHWQIDAVFRGQVQNDQTNSIYIGTEDGIDLKKLKEQPNEWQLYILQEWNRAFGHLADKYGWLKIELWW